MAALTLQEPDSSPRIVTLAPGVVTVGHGNDNQVALRDPTTRGAVIALDCQQGLYSISVIEGPAVLFRGRRQTHLRLSDGDTFRMGRTDVTFHLRPPPRPATDAAELKVDSARAEARDADGSTTGSLVAALTELHRFSERLASQESVDKLLEALLDGVIRLTGADKGFVVLLEAGRPQIRAARRLERHSMESSVESLSDSILKRVLESRKPLVVADARHDQEFNSSESVVSLRLCSVMCVPLLDRAGGVFGALYLGNDRVVDRFDQRGLELLSIYGAQASLLLQNARLVSSLSRENAQLKQAAEESRFGEIVGACDSMREVFRKLEKVAAADIPVLVTGETGTGKELIARELHRRSNRRGGPFVAINCGAIPENLLESELFGHVRGAFTGANTTRQGRFQEASGGTLFLDEIGELPLHLQVKLLRALQERSVAKVGENRPEAVDIRIVAATHRRLAEEIREGRFREDLYYRLNVINLHLPPLRDRGDDVEVLARHLLARCVREFGGSITGFNPAALRALRRENWPGNIRQLENRLKKAVVLAEGPLLTPADLELETPPEPVGGNLAAAVEQFKERYIDETLRRNGGNRTRTARELGVDARTVFRFLEARRARQEGRAPQEPTEADLTEESA